MGTSCDGKSLFGFRSTGRSSGLVRYPVPSPPVIQLTPAGVLIPTPRGGLDGSTSTVVVRHSPTVAEWLRAWLRGRRSLSEGTIRSYAAHIDRYLIPYLGDLQLAELTREHIAGMFDELLEQNRRVLDAREALDSLAGERRQGHGRGGGPLTAATLRRIHATLRAALYAAVPEHLAFNPAVRLELPAVRANRSRVWTEERVARWRETGQVPSAVMVWTPGHLGHFLDHAVGDLWYPLYHLYAYTGLRRGEGCGLHWTELDLNGAMLTVLWQISQYGWKTQLTAPKTDASSDIVHLDAVTVKVLRAHRQNQLRRKAQAGRTWRETGLVFTERDGQAIHPARVTRRFHQLASAAGLPPVRLHDLRHTHATVALAAGASLKAVQHRLRHAHYSLTADT